MAETKSIPFRPTFKDESFRRYGMLRVVSRATSDPQSPGAKWNCVCDCGSMCVIRGQNLRSGATISCGCRMIKTAKTHGLSGTNEYKIWRGMIARCRNVNSPAYPAYGGRGICVCDSWIKSFETFYADMGPRPSKGHSLDRFPDGAGNYEPGNVRWATHKQQCDNRKPWARMWTFRGKSLSLTDWSRLTGIPRPTLIYRLQTKGWDIAKALTHKAKAPVIH